MGGNADGNPAPNNDPQLPLGQIAAWFEVTKWSLLEQERRGRVRYERIRVNGVLTAVARPSQIRHLPVYRVGDAARIADVSTRTIHRWAKTGRLLLSRSESSDHWRTTPNSLAKCLRRRREEQRKPRPPRLTSLLDGLLDAESGSERGR